MADADVITAYGEGYDRGADVVHQELRSWRPGQHRPECDCDSCTTVRILRGHFFDEVTEIINDVFTQRQLEEHAGLE